MRKLSTVEKSGLCLAAILVLGGAWLALCPKETVGRIAANDRLGSDRSYILKLSKQECRVYGLLTVGAGLAVGALAVYPLKR